MEHSGTRKYDAKPSSHHRETKTNMDNWRNRQDLNLRCNQHSCLANRHHKPLGHGSKFSESWDRTNISTFKASRPTVRRSRNMEVAGLAPAKPFGNCFTGRWNCCSPTLPYDYVCARSWLFGKPPISSSSRTYYLMETPCRSRDVTSTGVRNRAQLSAVSTAKYSLPYTVRQKNSGTPPRSVRTYQIMTPSALVSVMGVGALCAFPRHGGNAQRYLGLTGFEPVS